MAQNAGLPRVDPVEPRSGTAAIGTESRHDQHGGAEPSDLTPETRLLSGRFVVRSRLGAGGMGTVYRATDTRIGADVALKVLHRSGGWGVYSIKREFRALASVVHPNLIALHELYCDDSDGRSLWFFTMPLIEGLDFGKRLRRGLRSDGAGACDFDALRLLLPQLVSGIHALHTTGKLHRDLKASNILVDRSDRVVILDFGVVRDLLTDAANGEAELGTPAYMAPELRFGGVSASRESDWYSLGVVLFEAITGSVPRPGSTQPPSAFAEGVPSDLDRLCVALLQVDPTKRPTAHDIARAIGASLEPPIVESYEPFIGRRPDLERMRAALQSLEAGLPTLFEIEGASGIGKTSLCRQFVDEAQHQLGAWVLRGRCYEREAVPFRGLDAIVDQISEELTGLPLPSSISPEQLAAAVRIFPVLGRGGSLVEPDLRRPTNAVLARESGFDALACLVESLARGRPVVISIDDVQWADSDSAKLLARLLARCSHCKLLLVLSHRGAVGGAESFMEVLNDQLQSVQTRLNRQRTQLELLSETEARALATSLMPDAGEDSVVRVVRESRGLPMFLCELARQRPGGQSEAMPPSIAEAFEQRISLLQPSARALLEVLAVASRPLEKEFALGAANVPLEDAAIVHALSVARLATTRVDMPTTRLETYHDRIREGILERLSGTRVREIHENLATALDRLENAEPELRFTHYLGAGRVAEARVAALEAADYADRTLAFGRAAALYEQALGLDAQAPDRWMVNEKMGNALVHARRGATAGEAFDRAVALYRETASPEPSKLLSLRNRAAEQHLQSADTQRGVAVIKEVLMDHGIDFPESNARATLTILANRVRLVLKGFDVPSDNRADAALEARMESLWIASKSLCFVSTIPATLFSGMLALTAFQAGHARYLVRGLCMVAAQEAMMEVDYLYRRADKLCATVLRLARESGDPYEMGFYHLCRAAIGWFQGKFQVTVEHAESAEELFSKLDRGSSYERAVAHLWGLHALAMTGNLKKLQERTQEVRHDAYERSDVFGERNAVLGQSTLARLAADEAELALERAEAVMTQTSAEFMGHDYHLLVTRVTVAWYQGDPQRAWEHVATTWPGVQSAMFDKLACMRDELLNLRAHAALALAKTMAPDATVRGLRGRATDRRQLMKLAEADARAIASHSLPHCAPYASLIRASIAAIAQDHAGSAKHLQRAIEGFDQAGMALYREASRYAAARAADASTAWFEEQGVTDPVRFMRAVMPCLASSQPPAN